jgi:flavodoxin
MISLKEIIYEVLNEVVISVSDLDNTLEQYRKDTNWTDWYMSGGCYTFADGLNKYLGNRGKYVAIIEPETKAMVHVCVLYGGKYCDYNGCRSKNDILSDITINGTPIWKTINRSQISSEHNFDNSEVTSIVKNLNKIR